MQTDTKTIVLKIKQQQKKNRSPYCITATAYKTGSWIGPFLNWGTIIFGFYHSDVSVLSPWIARKDLNAVVNILLSPLLPLSSSLRTRMKRAAIFQSCIALHVSNSHWALYFGVCTGCLVFGMWRCLLILETRQVYSAIYTHLVKIDNETDL